MLLSRPDIVKHMKKGNIIIEPFKPDNLKTTSYDVTLGDWFFKENRPEGRTTIHNMYDDASVALIWSGPHKAISAKELKKHTKLPELKNIGDSEKVILLGPGETILGHTLEFIGGRNVCVTKMYARSSLGRNFIEVCKDAGWGDIGYFNRWTMEITNNSQHYSIPLVVGRRIAQIVFYETAPLETATDYALESGKYQTSQSLAELKKTWNPHMMIPRMHLDMEVRQLNRLNSVKKALKIAKKAKTK